MLITREKVDEILAVIPENARACYTGQSILAYCPKPTFSWEEINEWPDETDIDIFAYNNVSQATIVQAFFDAGWTTTTSIEAFKADRVRFWEPNKKFKLQTVKLERTGYPVVNISWRDGVKDAIDCITGFDMDYLMVAMDCKTKVFADLRADNYRVAHVNQYHSHFDPTSVEPTYWYRQFERVPKGWSRGIDTRPVAQQYLEWITKTLEQGDLAFESKTREYQNKYMEESLAPVLEAGVPREQAEAFYHMCRGESNTWDAARIRHEAMAARIKSWLESVEDY